MAIEQNQDPPAMCTVDVLGDMPRAGDRLRQLQLREAAWEMLEDYRTPGGIMGTRFSNEWLGARNWRVQLVPHLVLTDADTIPVFDPLVEALRRRRIGYLLGTFMSVPSRGKPSAVWQVPAEGEALSAFFEAHRYDFHLLFMENHGFAIHANDGDFAAFAGPEAFLRKALPEALLGSAATADLRAAMEHDFGPGSLDGILAHYEPFFLDD